MAAKGSRGSFLLEFLIVLLALLLIAVIIVPNQIWEEEEQISIRCRNNMNAIFETERFYYQKFGNFTDSLSKMLTVVQSDSGLQERQTLVSLTQSFVKVVDNVLSIPSIEMISKISQATFEITGDLYGNERYFRRYNEIAQNAQQIVREMVRIDSSIAFPNFSRTKLFIDSLRYLKEGVSDYQLQIAILKAINSVDSLKLYYTKIEKDAFNNFWREEHTKISQFISDIRATDISKVSTVPDRLKKFIDQINSSVQILNSANELNDAEAIEVQKQNLTELHQKFLSPEFFILTKRYSLTSLNEVDSILIYVSQEDFYCPDAKESYLMDTTKKRLTIECPNLLDIFQKRFKEDIEPIRNVPVYQQVADISDVIERTKLALDTNRILLRRNTNLLLQIKELTVEMEDINNVFFYRYVNDTRDFIRSVDEEKKLSIIKPAIEDILNPLDTLGKRIETGNIADLEKKLNYFNDKLQQLDSAITETRLPSAVRRQVVSNTAPFQEVFNIVKEIKGSFTKEDADAFEDTSEELEETLLNALEGENENMYIIFNKKHINHGYIKGGEKSWEAED